MEDAIPQGRPTPDARPGHESLSLPVRPLIVFTIGLTGLIVASMLLLRWWMDDFRRKEERVDALYPGRLAIGVDEFPAPRLQESPPVDLVRMMHEERLRIGSYGWVDRKAGIARIPVDRAMDILAEKGLPRVPARPPAAGTPPNTTIPPAGKREEAGAAGRPPASEQPDRPKPDAKRGDQP